jgi:hypothetical protein
MPSGQYSTAPAARLKTKAASRTTNSSSSNLVWEGLG